VELVDKALSHVNLRSDQSQALQQIAADVDAKVGDVDQAKRDFIAALANQVEAGNVDECALRPEMQRVIDAAVAASPDLRSAFQKLHDILDPEQRKEFVAALRDELKQHEAKMDPKAQVERWSKKLNLTDDQKAKITYILSEERERSERAHGHLDRVLDAFAADSFSIDQVAPAASAQKHTEKMLRRIVDVARDVTEVLTPEQRQIAATVLREKAEGKTDESGSGETGAPPEPTGSSSEALWGAGYGSTYQAGSTYGFSQGYSSGYAGAYFF